MITPIALTIAGSDSGGGAGIQADLKAFSALGVYGASVITALTAQNTVGVQGVKDVPTSFIRQQMTSVLSDLDVQAIKIGMLSRSPTIQTVARGLEPYGKIPVVLDPVMVAASGDMLLQDSAVATLQKLLIPLATLVTPNLPEAAALTGRPIAVTEDEMEAQANAILTMGAKAVLIKGGHGTGPESVDLLVRADSVLRLTTPRIATRNVHGTGCTLSSAVAAGLAKGLSLENACREAKVYTTKAIREAHRLSIGKGQGPSHHFHSWW